MSRPTMTMVVVWIAWLLILWVNELPVAWPPQVDIAAMIPFSEGSDYDPWYHWTAAALCVLAGWQAFRLTRWRHRG